MSTHVDEAVRELLRKNTDLVFIKKLNKVKCNLSGHEMPCKAAIIQSYIQGKKYHKLRESKQFDWSAYKLHLVPSTKKHHERQLFCKLTWRHLNNKPSHIQRHIEGRRFQKALKRYEECQRTGETYRPRKPRRVQDDGDIVGKGSPKKDSLADSEVSEEGDSDVDSMSDLYPDGMLNDNDEEEEEEEGDEENGGDMDQDDSDFDNLGASENDSLKRPIESEVNGQGSSPVKKFKQKNKTKAIQAKGRKENINKKTKAKD